MGSQERIFRKERLFPTESLCNHCQSLLPQGATEGACMAYVIRKKTEKRIARNPNIKHEAEKLIRNYNLVAEKVWGCELTDTK